MACCGRSHGGTQSGPRTSGAPARTFVIFEYRGSSPMTTYGRATGIRYHFPGTHARIRVDARDAPALRIVQGLDVVETG